MLQILRLAEFTLEEEDLWLNFEEDFEMIEGGPGGGRKIEELES